MATPCVITVAITGSLPKKKDNPAVPITVAEQIESTQEAFEAGATLVHLHAREDDGTPSSSPERFAQVLDGIRKSCRSPFVKKVECLVGGTTRRDMLTFPSALTACREISGFLFIAMA